MKDTSPKVEEKWTRLLMEKTPEQRVKMGCSMYDTAKRIVISSILEETPQISSFELRRELFLRFYGNDFNSDQQKKIISWLGKPT